MKSRIIVILLACIMLIATSAVCFASDIGETTCPKTVKAGVPFSYTLKYPDVYPQMDTETMAEQYYMCPKCYKCFYEDELIDGIVEGTYMKVCPECKNDPGNSWYINQKTSNGEPTYLARCSACPGSGSQYWTAGCAATKSYRETIPVMDPSFNYLGGSPATIKVPGKYYFTVGYWCYESWKGYASVIDPSTNKPVKAFDIDYEKYKEANYTHDVINVLGKVKFNANKGKIKSSTKWISQNAKVGKLPKATRKGYKFKGWYTKKKGGKKITANTKVKFTKATQVYYAQWKKK